MSSSLRIVHQLPGRIRFRADPMDKDFERIVHAVQNQAGVHKVVFSRRTGSILVFYRDSSVSGKDTSPECAVQGSETAARDSKAGSRPKSIVSLFFLFRRFLPPWVRFLMSFNRARPFLVRGLESLRKGRADLNLLDSLAIGISLFRRDYRSVMIITTLLGLGEYLEQWTRKRSMENLARDLMYCTDRVWIRQNGTEQEVSIKEVRPGDLVVVRSGLHIPVDGTVASGQAMVNQSTMTGEPLAVSKKQGASVYAGTVLEEGEITVKVTKAGDQTRVFQLMKIIEESERLKSGLQARAEYLADKIVPATLFLSLFTFILTRNINRAVSVLLVDYSCAIKLSTPLTMLSAMRESSTRGVAVKGGKYLELMNRVDTFVFDKTGTLTRARPKALEVVAFNGFERREVLRIAACLEEHFPHPVASAVVALADRENIIHHENHSTVHNILAHGIHSAMEGREVMVGSRHFIEKHGQVDLGKYQDDIDGHLKSGLSVLYVSVGQKLAGLILLDDPLRDGAQAFIQKLKQKTGARIYLLTGDGEQTAQRINRTLDLDGYQASLLPEDKAQFIRKLKAQGRTVAMVGDGMNDSLALSEADVGISMKHGADLSREVCDILLTNSSLEGIITARNMSARAMSRIKQNYGLIIGVNSSLIFLGLAGRISPLVSAMLHNLTTVLVSLNSIRPLEKTPLQSRILRWMPGLRN
ncbi:heavy metal translocating P-type ATPase [Desulfonatronovibrio hydrogenovorans]|uniref:heavy metal translocating P-type ATPase n=1 Tax=Desulfonatronovibrio hydrogenovorans TaxID=53245 RepID=UPI00068E86D6|nr:heavy metal translocating P-type ATPase [Desulfonatronovibrio hydrogenovorans]